MSVTRQCEKHFLLQQDYRPQGGRQDDGGGWKTQIYNPERRSHLSRADALLEKLRRRKEQQKARSVIDEASLFFRVADEQEQSPAAALCKSSPSLICVCLKAFKALEVADCSPRYRNKVRMYVCEWNRVCMCVCVFPAESSYEGLISYEGESSGKTRCNDAFDA